MAEDYCRYILSKCSRNDRTSIDRTKEEMYQYVDLSLDVRREELNQVGSINADKYLFDVLDLFFSKEKLLFGYPASDLVRRYIDREAARLETVKKSWEENKKAAYPGMYDELFEIIYRYLLIMENARISVYERKEETVNFHGSNLEIDRLLGTLSSYLENEKPQKAGRKSLSLFRDSLNRLGGHEKKYKGDIKGAFHYFYYVAHATFTRKEEITMGINYGWSETGI